MPTTPSVSVLMPCYNAGDYLRKAVDSVIRQTFQDWELVVVDDGSDDGRTRAALDDTAALDPRIRVIARPHAGLAAALNTGLSASRAPLVARLDADDIALPTRLESQVRQMEARPDLGILGSQVQNIGPDDRPLATWTTPTGPGFIAWHLHFSPAIAHPTVMMRRDLVAALQGYAPLLFAEDWDLWERAGRESVIDASRDTLVLRRVWPGNFGARKDARRERIAVGIAARRCAATLGSPMPLEDAAALRALYQGSPPARPDEARRVAALLARLHRAFLAQELPGPADRAAVRRDVARKLALLARCTGLRAPLTAIRLLGDAFQVDAAFPLGKPGGLRLERPRKGWT